MANQFTVQGTPVFVAADPHPKRVSVWGDPIAYGDIGLTHDNARGVIKEGKPQILGTGQWLLSQGSTLVTVEEVPGEKADINPSRSKDAPVNEPPVAADQAAEVQGAAEDSAVAEPPKRTRKSSTSSTGKKKG